jgi:hypothetical protein
VSLKCGHPFWDAYSKPDTVPKTKIIYSVYKY